MTFNNYPADAISRKAALKAVLVLPWVLSDDETDVTNPDGSPPLNFILNRVRFTKTQIKAELLKRKPKEKMQIISQGGFYFLKSKAGDVHATRYRNRDDANLAAIKIAKGLTHWQSTTDRLLKLKDHSNAV
jgi:hypothetical protein